MKLKYLLSITVILLIAFNACKKQDSIYKQYILTGGLPYTGKASSPKAYSGHNRIKISWLRGADPNVVKARVFWNNFADSVEVEVPETGDTVSIMLDDMAEKNYSFIIKTYDARGISSVPVEVLGAVYGQLYQSQILSRPVVSQTVDKQGTVTINWGSADISGGAAFTEVKYKNTVDVEKVLRFPVANASSTLPGIKPGTSFQYRTVYRPDSLTMDDFFTPYDGAENFAFDKKDWTIIAFSTNHPTADNAVGNLIDGTDGTRWHTLVDGGASKYPHFATIDMGVERIVTQFGLARTTAFGGGDNRAPDKIQLLTSIDNVTWKNQGIFDFNRNINGEQAYPMPDNTKARYFKFVGISGPEYYLVMGEVSAYGF